MWHKPCRTFHLWCLCIKTRCLLSLWWQAIHWADSDLLPITPSGTNFIELWIKNNTFHLAVFENHVNKMQAIIFFRLQWSIIVWNFFFYRTWEYKDTWLNYNTIWDVKISQNEIISLLITVLITSWKQVWQVLDFWWEFSWRTSCYSCSLCGLQTSVCPQGLLSQTVYELKV